MSIISHICVYMKATNFQGFLTSLNCRGHNGQNERKIIIKFHLLTKVSPLCYFRHLLIIQLYRPIVLYKFKHRHLCMIPANTILASVPIMKCLFSNVQIVRELKYYITFFRPSFLLVGFLFL